MPQLDFSVTSPLLDLSPPCCAHSGDWEGVAGGGTLLHHSRPAAQPDERTHTRHFSNGNNGHGNNTSSATLREQQRSTCSKCMLLITLDPPCGMHLQGPLAGNNAGAGCICQACRCSHLCNIGICHRPSHVQRDGHAELADCGCGHPVGRLGRVSPPEGVLTHGLCPNQCMPANLTKPGPVVSSSVCQGSTCALSQYCLHRQKCH